MVGTGIETYRDFRYFEMLFAQKMLPRMDLSMTPGQKGCKFSRKGLGIASRVNRYPIIPLQGGFARLSQNL